MDMTFLLKSFLPPGVTVEQLTQVAQDIAAKVVAAVQRIEQTHELLTEQNVMLRRIIANSQQQSFNNPEDLQHDTISTPDGAASADGSIDGIGPVGAAASGTGSSGSDGNGSVAPGNTPGNTPGTVPG